MLVKNTNGGIPIQVRTSTIFGDRLGPVCIISLSEFPFVVSAEPLNTALSVVVKLFSVNSPW